MSGDSMNVYGSYIDDSYVGDFSGEVTNPEVMIDEVVGGVLEFSFDSFGPESMIFPKNGEPSEVEDNSNSTNYNNTATNQPVEFLKRNTSLTQSQRRKIRPKIDIQEIFNSSDETSAHDDSTVNNLIENETSKEDLDDVDDEDEQSSHHSNFNTNPDIKSHGNSNTSSTQANSYSNTKEDNYFKHDTHYLDSSPVSTKEELEDTLQKQGSFAKKKIPVNKELLSNDDMIIDFPPSHQEQEVSRVPELTVQEEMNETRSWRESCPIGDKGEVKKIDLKVIEPYKKVLSHGGYYHHYNSAQLSKNNTNPSPGPAIIIFSACYLPDRSRKDYGYVMDNLFMYVLTTLHELVADDYILIYFHNAGCAGVSSNNMPTFSWLKRCYTMIDKRLRKNLKSLFLVHPTFWLKTFVIMIKPFISSKFSKKLKFVSTLAELNDLVPIESTVIPPPVKQYDEVASNLEKNQD
ncbi:BCL2/adenovirus E1B 19 kDa protein-interacting protein 2-like isoform X2 [Panonychus citri]|uniref:BCL2/adenovirus E1B 19 kDa protein-interacting protein 2-like isoform X2 n=1 Tax=Panonychus citri TaxID=50023 RepID=UPI0023075390|nr:BCL2/adenovirus E1B 19 kDa protein-interacting protein 2-like isoform X2 [Panonychus citri]